MIRKLTKRGIRLETISEGDELFFSEKQNHPERVVEVDIINGVLCTQRTVKNTEKDSDEFPFRWEAVAYGDVFHPLSVITPNSTGRIYNYGKTRNLE